MNLFRLDRPMGGGSNRPSRSLSHARRRAYHNLEIIGDRFSKSECIVTHKRGIKSYPRSFEGQALVTWLMMDQLCDNREEMLLIAKRMWNGHIIRHIKDLQSFEDSDDLFVLVPPSFRPGGANDLSGRMTAPEFLHRAQARERETWLTLTTPQRVYLFFDEPWRSLPGKIASAVILVLIFVSCVSFIVQSTGEFRKIEERRTNGEETSGEIDPFFAIETGCIIVFTIEYLCRLFTAGSMSSLYWLSAETPGDLVLNKVARGGVQVNKKKNKNSLDEAIREGKTSETQEGLLQQSQTDFEAVHAKQERYRHKHLSLCEKTWRFCKQPLNIIDLIAILPFYFELMFLDQKASLTVFRVLRLARVFRVFKVSKYSEVMQTFARVMAKSVDALLLMFFFVALGALIFGSMIFYAEGGIWMEEYQAYMRPTKDGLGLEPTPFTSIPASFWFIFVTTTTVGYGDHYPTTWEGKVVATLTMHMGVLVLALPVTIIGTNFALEMDNEYLDEKEEEDMKILEDDDMERNHQLQSASHSLIVSAVGPNSRDENTDHHLDLYDQSIEPYAHRDLKPISSSHYLDYHNTNNNKSLPSLKESSNLKALKTNENTINSPTPNNTNNINNSATPNNTNNINTPITPPQLFSNSSNNHITNNNNFIIINNGNPNDALSALQTGMLANPALATPQQQHYNSPEEKMRALLAELRPLTRRMNEVCSAAKDTLKSME